MMTKEEYKKTLIRMWDSARIGKYKGANSCSNVNCKKCPVTFLCGNHMDNMINAYEIIEFAEQWAKEHPLETNGTRFLENYSEADIYGRDDEFIYIKFPFSHGVEDCAKIPIAWWESEVDDADCD